MPCPPQHLLTVRLERDIRSTDDCLARLKVLEAQGRVWGQDLILQVKDQELMLRDVESKVPPGQGTPQSLVPPGHGTQLGHGTHSGPSTPINLVFPQLWHPLHR